MLRRLLAPLLLLVTSVTVGVGVAAAPDRLEVGVGRADITSPTGYYMQGWVRSDAVLRGVQTLIPARAIVLRRGHQKKEHRATRRRSAMQWNCGRRKLLPARRAWPSSIARTIPRVAYLVARRRIGCRRRQ